MEKQLVSVRYNVSAAAGDCLWFTQESLSVPHMYAVAWDAWEAAKYKHEDQLFPSGVAVPIFFDWSATIKWSDGVWRKTRAGHAAWVDASGIIHSSPLSGVGSVTFSSVAQLVAAFGNGIRYVGWTEDLSGVRVMEGETMAASEQKVDELTVRLAYNNGLFRQPSDDELKHWVDAGVTVEQVLRAILTSPEHEQLQRSIDANESAKTLADIKALLIK